MNNPRMPVAYVVGPYRNPSQWEVECNIYAAEKVALTLWRMGYAVICPQKNTAHFGGACPDNVWLDGDMELLRRSDLVVTLASWYWSTGSKFEVAMADGLGIPRFNWRIDNDGCLENEDYLYEFVEEWKRKLTLAANKGEWTLPGR